MIKFKIKQKIEGALGMIKKEHTDALKKNPWNFQLKINIKMS